MILILCTLLAMGAIIYVARPFFHRNQTWGLPPKAQKLNDLLLRKEVIYASIRDLDFDYRMGKLPEEEHQRLVGEYKREAASVLAAIDRLQGRGDQREPHVETGQQKVREKGHIFCPDCGSQQQDTDTFCANCGHKLRR